MPRKYTEPYYALNISIYTHIFSKGHNSGLFFFFFSFSSFPFFSPNSEKLIDCYTLRYGALGNIYIYVYIYIYYYFYPHVKVKFSLSVNRSYLNLRHLHRPRALRPAHSPGSHSGRGNQQARRGAAAPLPLSASPAAPQQAPASGAVAAASGGGSRGGGPEGAAALMWQPEERWLRTRPCS